MAESVYDARVSRRSFDEHMRSALQAERRGRHYDACVHYAAAIAAAPRRGLAYLCLGCALGQLGRYDEAVQVLSLGHDRSERIFEVWRSPKTDPEVAGRSRYAETLLRRYMTAMHARSVAGYETQCGCGPLPRVRAAVWCQTHDAPFEYLHPRQRPSLLYMPDLDPVPWFDPTDVPGSAALAMAYPAIRREALRAVDDLREQVRPYIPANTVVPDYFAEMRGSMRWSSLHLYREGIPADDRVVAAFPETLAALAGMDLVLREGHPMEVVVSILAPRSRIPAHYGLANTRLTVHLPVLVPGDCSLTVAGESRHPREGRVLAFDDGFHHEAHNPTDEPRVHLIFEAWRPDLTGHEKAALTRCVEDRGRWARSRRVPCFEGGPADD